MWRFGVAMTAVAMVGAMSAEAQAPAGTPPAGTAAARTPLSLERVFSSPDLAGTQPQSLKLSRTVKAYFFSASLSFASSC